MKPRAWFLALAMLAIGHCLCAQTVSTNSTPVAGLILIAPSSTSTPGFGMATLTLGTLTRTSEFFSGTYQVRVSPYSFKNEKGKIHISVSDDSLRQIIQSHKTTVTGTATNSENGRTRTITAVISPKNAMSGSVKISFNVGKRKMEFNSSYCFT